jgi:hypothetical protein
MITLHTDVLHTAACLPARDLLAAAGEHAACQMPRARAFEFVLSIVCC